MNKIDFSQEFVRVTLPNPAFYLNPKTKEYVVIDSVDIKRLNTPQIALLRTRIAQQMSPQATGAAAMVPFVQIICKIAISRLYEGEKVFQADVDRVVDVIPFESSYKVALIS